MKRGRIIGFLIDFIIIAVSFEISEYFAVQIFQSEKWYVELIIYMLVFMSLQGIVSLVKRLWSKKNDEKRARKQNDKFRENTI